MTEPTLFDVLAEKLEAQAKRLKTLAASGTAGCVARRRELTAVRHDQLRCSANGWRGSSRA